MGTWSQGQTKKPWSFIPTVFFGPRFHLMPTQHMEVSSAVSLQQHFKQWLYFSDLFRRVWQAVWFSAQWNKASYHCRQMPVHRQKKNICFWIKDFQWGIQYVLDFYGSLRADLYSIISSIIHSSGLWFEPLQALCVPCHKHPQSFILKERQRRRVKERKRWRFKLEWWKFIHLVGVPSDPK